MKNGNVVEVKYGKSLDLEVFRISARGVCFGQCGR